MDEGVVASTGNQGLPLKKIDTQYRNSNIIDIRKLECFTGNSYLSLISMFQQ